MISIHHPPCGIVGKYFSAGITLRYDIREYTEVSKFAVPRQRKMSTLYRTRFRIVSPESQGVGLLREIQSALLAWAQPRFQAKIADSGEWSNGRETLKIDAGTAGDYGFCSVQSTLRSDTRLNFKAATVGGEVENSIDILRIDNDGHANGHASGIRAPTLMLQLTSEFDCQVEGKTLGSSAHNVTSANIDQFINHELFGERELPILAISAPIGRPHYIDPHDLQMKLVGIAQVFSFNASTANAILGNLSERRCRRLACYGGAARLYHPGCKPGSVSGAHPIWMPNQLSNGTWKQIFQNCIAGSGRTAQSSFYDEVYRVVRDTQYVNLKAQFDSIKSRKPENRRDLDRITQARDDLRRKTKELQDTRQMLASRELEIKNIGSEIETQRAQHQGINEKLLLATREIENLEGQLEIKSQEVNNAREQLQLTQNENTDLFNELERLDGELEQVKAESQHFQNLFTQSIDQGERIREDRDRAESKQYSQVDRQQTSPSRHDVEIEEDGLFDEVAEHGTDAETIESVIDAVELAQRELEGLRFFPSAIKSARKSQYKPAAKLFSTFKTLDECASVLAEQQGSFDMTLQNLLRQFQVDFVPDESESTNNKLAKTRRFRDREEKRTRYMPAHVRLGGKQLRIHLLWDDLENRWLIGHVGRHLETSRN